MSSLHDKERALHAHPVLWNVALKAPEEPKQIFTHLCIPAAISSVNSAPGELMLVFCCVLSSVCSPVQVLIAIKTNPVKSELDGSHGSEEKHFGVLSPCPQLCSPAWPQHLLHPAMTILSLFIHAAKQISPAGQALFQPEMLHLLLARTHGSHSLSRTKSAQNQTETSEENQVTPTKPHLYFRLGPHNLVSSVQQKTQPLLQAGHLFQGEKEEFLPRHSQPSSSVLLIYSLNNSMANIHNQAANYGSG